MNRLEHYREAERLLVKAGEIPDTIKGRQVSEEDYRHSLMAILATAQVHATLACAEVPGR